MDRLEKPIESLDDLINQYKISYAPLNNSNEMKYLQRMANIEKKFYEIWIEMSLNDSLSAVERARLAVWDYPMNTKYTKLWREIKQTGMPNTLEEAVERVRKSTGASGFALIGDSDDVRYLAMINCDMVKVGQDMSSKPYAIAVQAGSQLKELFDKE